MSEQYKSLDPAARARYLAKLQVLGLKEADDRFATWNNSKFEDNMSLWPPVEYPHLFCYFVERPGVYTQQELMQWKSLEAYIQLLQKWACAHCGYLACKQHHLYPESHSEPQPAIS